MRKAAIIGDALSCEKHLEFEGKGMQQQGHSRATNSPMGFENLHLRAGSHQAFLMLKFVTVFTWYVDGAKEAHSSKPMKVPWGIMVPMRNM